MRKVLSHVLALIVICSSAYAVGKAPAAVITAFNQKFPNATNVKWDKENAHEYEASFTWKSVKYSANFSDGGEWMETESTVAFNQLPEKVQQAFNTAHKGATVKSTAKIETSKGATTFEIEVTKGGKTSEAFYNADGTNAIK